jgi:hypothetical protein
MLKVLITTFFLCSLYFCSAQITVKYKPNSELSKDAEIVDYLPNLNINDDKLSPYAWTIGGNLSVHRCLIEFIEMSNLPPNAVIQSAKLSLFFKTNHPSTPSDHSGANNLFIRRVTSPWTETGVTWNNQPTTSTNNTVLLPASSSATQDYSNIDVTNLVVDMMNSNNYGFMISLQDETPFRQVLLASSEHSLGSLHPELEITYDFPTNIKERTPIEFNFYPNPAKNKFIVRFNQVSNSRDLMIINCTGQVVLTKKMNSSPLEVNISHLTSGTYFVRFSNEKTSSVTKKLQVY